MVHGQVRYKKLASDIEEEIEPEHAGEDSDEEQVTVHFKLPADSPSGKAGKRLTCFRLSTTLVLLAIVLVFVLLQWYKWWPEPEGFHSVGTSSMSVSQEHDQHHHHTTMENEHEHGEDDKHGHGEGDKHEYGADDKHEHGEDDKQKHGGDKHEHGEDDKHEHGEGDEHEHGADPHHHEHTALYHHAVVLTASANCSSIGKAILQEGGNVVDAAIAALLCLGVVHPHTAGIGGLFSAILYNSTSGSLKTIRSTTPRLSSATFGVPSILQGIRDLHSEWGRSEWRRLFREAITLAQEGFFIDDVLGRALESYKEEIHVSRLCDLFCDASGHTKSIGAVVKNQNLSELLQSVSLNENNFLETLAMKLSGDLSQNERPDFLVAIQHSRGEINDTLIIEREKYSVLSASLPFSGQMLSDILEHVRLQNFSFVNGADLNRTSAVYRALLNFVYRLNNSDLVQKYPGLIDSLSRNTQNSDIAVLDKYGNFIIMSASLNSMWGSWRFLPSSGVLLNSFTANISNFNIPLVLQLIEDDASRNDDAEDKEVEILAFSGGPSALFNAAVLLHNRIDFGMSSEEALCRPLFHLEPGTSSAFCLSGILNDSDFYIMFSEKERDFQQVDACSDDSRSMLLRLHADHVSAYGAPLANAHYKGY